MKPDLKSRSEFGRKEDGKFKSKSVPVASPAGGVSVSYNYDAIKRRKLKGVSTSTSTKTSAAVDPASQDEKGAKTNTISPEKSLIGTDVALQNEALNSSTRAISFSFYNGLSERWKNWIVRGIFGLLMIAGFFYIIYLGPVALILLTLAIQVRCFAEVINIGYTIYKMHDFPWYRFRSLSWYFLITSNYFFYMETSLGIEVASASNNLLYYNNKIDQDEDGVVNYSEKLNRTASSESDSGSIVHANGIFQFLSSYNRFISFLLYLIGFLWFFVSISLARKNKKYRGRRIETNQYNLFAFTHICLLMVVAQSYLIIQNIFEGLIWYVIPVSMIICNDAMAYFFGFFMGRTPLIQLSPKKTWEGYIGGGISTVIFGLFASHFLCQFPFFTCPVQYTDSVLHMKPNVDSEVSAVFTIQEYAIPSILVKLGVQPIIQTYPFVLHSIALSVFSSVIGPFGGFFASGFKRAFKIKDFAAVIPGHGGVLDRFDCQFLMATFVHVYIASFIQPSPQRLYQQVLNLSPEAQLELLNSLGDHLRNEGLI